jgi:hypothetical protein
MFTPVDVKQLRTAAGVIVGFKLNIKPTNPAANGVAIEVPPI